MTNVLKILNFLVSPYLTKNVAILLDNKVSLPNGSCFLDKFLPPASVNTVEDETFPKTYYINLHNKVRSSGTYNFAGARVELIHFKLNIDLFRKYLVAYADMRKLATSRPKVVEIILQIAENCGKKSRTFLCVQKSVLFGCGRWNFLTLITSQIQKLLKD